MSGVKANWHLASLDVDDDDPMQDIADMGTAIDLTRTDAEISLDIQRTMRMEHVLLSAHGTKCDIKEAALDPPCWSCPHFRSDSSPAGRLCALGREQADLIHEMDTTARLRHQALAGELAATYLTTDVREARELADALL